MFIFIKKTAAASSKSILVQFGFHEFNTPTAILFKYSWNGSPSLTHRLKKQKSHECTNNFATLVVADSCSYLSRNLLQQVLKQFLFISRSEVKEIMIHLNQLINSPTPQLPNFPPFNKYLPKIPPKPTFDSDRRLFESS